MDLRSVLNTADSQQQGHVDAHSSPVKPAGRDTAHTRQQQQQQQPPCLPPSYQGSSQQQQPFHVALSPGAVPRPMPLQTAMPTPSPSSYRPSPTPTPTTGAGGSASAYPFETTSPNQRHQFPPGPYHQLPQQQSPQPQHHHQQHQQHRHHHHHHHHHRHHQQQQQQPSPQQQQPSPQQQQPSPQQQQPPTPLQLQRPAQHQRRDSLHHHQLQHPQQPGFVIQQQHQRSRSAHSTPTPNPISAQPLPFGSLHAHVPEPADFARHPPQPATPLGPPPHSSAAAFVHPPSPQQQRTPQPAAQRLSSTPGTHDSSVSDALSRPREGSPSVSPRTRVTSLANSNPGSMTVETITPAKRKLDDRSVSPRELDHRGARPSPAEPPSSARPSESRVSQKRCMFYADPPIWAQSARVLGSKMPLHANFVFQKRPQAHVNGKSQPPSRHTSPEAPRTQATIGTAQPAPTSQSLLGPWEASIMGVKPYEEISKKVADFIFIHVINNPDSQEIASRGIQFEIEAKLGTLIDKDTNHRVDRLLDSECVLHDTGRVAFRSSMTEIQHKAFNDFLNSVVVQTDPRALSGASRVQVHYKHRREIDRFFELSPQLQGRIPGCMRSRLGSRSRSVRVRVTYDQKTHEILYKIIKARVADLDLHMPTCPMDCRLSINLEMDWDGSAEELEQLGAANAGDKAPDRCKDRLSYSQGHYQIDLTQVTQNGSGPGNTARADREHELEIELAADSVMDQGTRAMNGAPHRYQELVEGLVDNIRVLARKARDFSS